MHPVSTEAQESLPLRGTPDVSVVVPAYGVAQYIGGTLRSIFSQTFTDYEVIVVNDGSPDTVELEAALTPFRERIIYIKQENTGPSGARNAGIRQARGRFVAFLDGDDEWLPTFLEEQVLYLESDSSLHLVYADSLLFGDHPQAGQTSIDSYPSRAEAIFENLLRIECVVQTSAVVAYRETLLAAGLFDPRLSFAEDFDLWLRIVHGFGRIGHNQRVLTRHRMHRASLSADQTRMYEGRIAVYHKTIEALPLTPEQRATIETEIRRCTAQMHLDAGKQRIIAGDYDGAKTELRRAAQVSPTHKLRAVLLCLHTVPSLLGNLYRLREQR